MGIIEIAVFSLGGILLREIKNNKIKTTAIGQLSILALFWLQPASAIRHMDFWLPTATVFLIFVVFIIVQPPRIWVDQQNIITALITIGVLLFVALLRYIDPICCLGETVPPNISAVILVLFAFVWITFAIIRAAKHNWAASIPMILLLMILIAMKTQYLSLISSQALRIISGQSIELAKPFEIVWLGYSYLAFRLLHILRDYQKKRLLEFNLSELIAYSLFFPTIVAGPIDQIQHFTKEIRASTEKNAESFFIGLKRIIIGVFSKFVIADSLALIGLSAQIGDQLSSPLWSWVVVYAYSLRIYFDFSGYTDIAIGISTLVGIKLPENFMQPYLKTNLTTFWNSWHMTLTNWFRSYVFNPLTRSLRQSERGVPSWLIILLGQLTIMVLIGFWHGVSLNFLIWGLWHAVGLFIHNRWANITRSLAFVQNMGDRLAKLFQGLSWVVTFNFVSLGWIWFEIPEIRQALHVFSVLFGG